MSFLTGSIRAEKRGETDDFWYQEVGPMSKSGMLVTPDSAMRVAAVYRCVTLLSQTVAMLPLKVYRSLENGDSEELRRHPLYHLLHTQPNRTQTSIEYREMCMAHMLLRGNAYSYKSMNGSGQLSELIPFHPDAVTPWLMPDTGRLRYTVVMEGGKTEEFSDEEIFHPRGMMLDRWIGESVISHGRESIGTALAAEDYAARFFKNDARPRGILKMPGQFKSKDQRDSFIEDFRKAYGGSNRHRTAVLEHGMEYVPIGMDNRDAQFLESRNYQIEDIARLFGTPPYLIGHTEKQTSYGTGVDSLGEHFIAYTVLNWLTRWEQSIKRDLIRRPDVFAKHTTAALKRGDLTARTAYYEKAVTHGWMTRNEVRQLEDMNSLPGLDQPLQQLNMAPAGSEQDPAETLAQHECDSMRHMLDPSAPAKAVKRAQEFYLGFTERLVGIGLSRPDAEMYCKQSYEQIKALPAVEWEDMLDSWAHVKPQRLAEALS